MSDLVERLREQARERAEAQTWFTRNTRGENYSATEPEETLEWKGADEIERLRAAEALAIPVTGGGEVVGWLYHNEDAGAGSEWSENHPVECGEVPDARDIRLATAAELLRELLEAWKVAHEHEAEITRLQEDHQANFAGKVVMSEEAFAELQKGGHAPSPNTSDSSALPQRLDWVNCPICGEPDMRRETDDEGHSLITCLNMGCPSNIAALSEPTVGGSSPKTSAPEAASGGETE